MNPYVEARCVQGHEFSWLIGTPFICPACGYKMAQPRNRQGEPPSDILTPREREVVALIGAGLTNRQIADKLIIQERTVWQHVHNIRRKLGCQTRTQVARYAWEHGIEWPEQLNDTAEQMVLRK